MFRDGGWLEALQVSPNPVLLLYREFAAGETLEEENDVNGGNVTRVRPLTIDTRDDGVGISIVFLTERLAGDNETTTILDLGETDETASDSFFSCGPVYAHGFKRGSKFENGG